MAGPRTHDPLTVDAATIQERVGISRLTLLRWYQAGLLPAPERVSEGRPGGLSNRWPAWVVERARFVKEKWIAGHTLDEIKVLIEAQHGRQEAAPDRGTARERSKRRG